MIFRVLLVMLDVPVVKEAQAQKVRKKCTHLIFLHSCLFSFLEKVLVVKQVHRVKVMPVALVVNKVNKVLLVKSVVLVSLVLQVRMHHFLLSSLACLA